MGNKRFLFGLAAAVLVLSPLLFLTNAAALPPADGPADAAGLKTGDLIARYNGESVKSSEDLIVKVANTNVGKDVQVEIFRGADKQTVTIQTGKTPEFLAPKEPVAIEVRVEAHDGGEANGDK